MTEFSIDKVRVQVLAPPPESFVLGFSRLGEDRLSTSDGVREWQDVTGIATNCRISRGGRVDGATSRVDTGRMSVRLVNPGDVAADPRWKPGTPIRAMPTGGGPDFGTVDMPLSTTTWATSFVDFTVEAGDKIFLPAYAYGGTLRFIQFVIRDSAGSLVGGVQLGQFADDDAWMASQEASHWAREGGLPGYGNPVPWMDFQNANGLTISYHANDTSNPYWAIRDTTDLTPGETYRITAVGRRTGFEGVTLPVTIAPSLDAEGAAPYFTGVIEDVATEYSKDGRYEWLTVSAVDLVRDLARTPRYGAVVENNYGAAPWGNRVLDVVSSAGVSLGNVARASLTPVVRSISPSAWSRWGSLTSDAADTGSVTPASLSTVDAHLAVRDNAMAADTTVKFTPLERGVQTTLTGLTPGHYYAVSVNAGVQPTSGVGDTSGESRTYRLSADGVWGPPGVLYAGSQWPFNPANLKVAFRATSSSAVLRIARDFDGDATASASWRPEDYRIGYVRTVDVTDANDATMPPLQDVVYESTVLNHLEMACASVGVEWWADRRGGLSFNFPNDGTPPEVRLALSDVTEPSFTAADLSFDTARVVNQLTVTNHGRRGDPASAANHLAYDTTTALSADGSVEVYGARSSSVDFSLPEQFVQARGEELLDDATVPSLRATSVTVNAFEVPEAVELDIHDRITITHRGRTARYAVAGVTHDIGPSRWMTTLDLRKDD